jgi:hypothetical protein
MRRVIPALLALGGLLAGCGNHLIRVDSEPSGASLSVNGKFVGVTPTQFEESDDYTENLFVFKYEKEGYETRVDEHRKTEFCIRHIVDLRPYYIGILRKKPAAPAGGPRSAAAPPGSSGARS